MSRSVTAFGEILWDVFPDGSSVLGGAPFNFINRVRSFGVDGGIISRVGADDPGDQALDTARQQGIDVSLVQRDDSFPTGTVEVALDGNGSPDFTIIPNVAYDRIELTDDMIARVCESDCLCYGTLAQRSDVTRSTLSRLLEYADNTLKFCDINFRKDCYDHDSAVSSIHAADVLKLNDAEAFEIAEMVNIRQTDVPGIAVELVHWFKLTCCLVTLGGKGVFVFSDECGPGYYPGYDVDVVDTVGAGDTFSAGFLVTLLEGGTFGKAASFGNAVGAMAAMRKGGTSPFSVADVHEFLTRDVPRCIDESCRQYIS